MTANPISTETWYQDTENGDLWHGEHGVIVNTSALEERTFYFEVIRVRAADVARQVQVYGAPCA